MDDVQDLIFAAWKRVGPRLEADAHALAARLARRRTGFLTRPPRAWCLAVRASDHRIASGCERPVEHRVTLTAKLLRKVCAPVSLDAPGQTLDEVSAKLGTTPRGLVSARLNGLLRAHYVQGLGGRHGKPVPLLYTERDLDPCAKGWNETDELWSWTGRMQFVRVPKDLEATLTRVPRFRSHVSRHRYDMERHPELDGVGPRRKSQRLPPPPPDYVWYKWSRSGHFLGDDPKNWRKGPEDLGERPAKWVVKKRYKRTYKSVSSGSEHFNGFQWICPMCGKKCGTIYYPLPPKNVLERCQPRLAQVVDVVRKTAGFGCARCHRVNCLSAVRPARFWNQLIGYLSGGLLYGRDVPRPQWLKLTRKNKFTPHVNAPPSRRRPQVMEMVLKGMSAKQIAAELGLGKETVNWHIKAIYAQHGVRGRKALARKLGRAMPAGWETKKEIVQRELLRGRPYGEIEAMSKAHRRLISRYAWEMRRKGIAVAYQHKGSARRRATVASA